MVGIGGWVAGGAATRWTCAEAVRRIDQFELQQVTEP